MPRGAGDEEGHADGVARPMVDRRRALAGMIAASAASPRSAAAQVSPEPTSFDSRGHTIRAALFRPSERPARAGLVFMHGSGSVGPRQLGYARRFAEHGYIAAVPVYTDAAADDGARRLPIMQAWRDCAEDAVNWLITQGAPSERIALTGYSLGSHIAVDSALAGGLARAAIGITAGWDVYPPRPPRRRIPVLIVRASSDDHVRPASTDRLVRFLRDAAVPVREARIRDAEHIMTDEQWVEVQARSADFLTDALDLS